MHQSGGPGKPKSGRAPHRHTYITQVRPGLVRRGGGAARRAAGKVHPSSAWEAPAGAVLLDCSTIDVATAKEVIAKAEAAGYDMVDAPVSGGIAAANGGTLTFMVLGSATYLQRIFMMGCKPDAVRWDRAA